MTARATLWSLVPGPWGWNLAPPAHRGAQGCYSLRLPPGLLSSSRLGPGLHSLFRLKETRPRGGSDQLGRPPLAQTAGGALWRQVFTLSWDLTRACPLP